ncbi:MAG: NAD(P)/FAD-dependent oxidoreductase [Phycisphaerales bacterium]|nr:MAG: NAD(P)/FAD-dependent oxidoreductase [Phycisphaerales bacterium]
MHYDVVIIGAGMSGFAAGIRLAYFDKHVCIVEKHSAPGGLNSYYSLGGRHFDVGLHAVTNYASPEKRPAPLAKLLRQLRFQRDDFALCPQGYSEIRFPGRTLRFTNDIEVLTSEVAREFPGEEDKFRRLLAKIEAYDDTRLDQAYKPARPILRDALGEQGLIEMLLCPVMYYGSAQEHDMDFTQFVTIFKSLFFEGLARPRDGVRAIIRALIEKFCGCGGELKMNAGVEGIDVDNDRVTGLVLESGEQLTTDVVLSSAGYIETMRLCGGVGAAVPEDEPGRMSFVETIGVMDTLPQDLGHEATIVFFNDADTFAYSQPAELVDLRSGVVCCPSNYVSHEDMEEGILRLTWMANCEKWLGMDEVAYRAAKQGYLDEFVTRANVYVPGFCDRVVCTDMFTPRTIRDYTGHINGAVYGSPRKRRDGRTPIENLYICGTDQGFLGIIGAMLSGISIANLQVLSKD